MMTIRELFNQHGKRSNVYCGCIGWVSGHPRATRGVIAQSPGGTRTYAKCNECGRIWHRRNQTKGT